MPEDSRPAARKAFDQYHAHLKASGSGIQVAGVGDRVSLSATDPLYGGVFVDQAGRYLVGAVRAKKIPAAKKIVGEISGRVSGP